MTRSPEPSATIHAIRVPAAVKARLVRAARREGQRLGAWIIAQALRAADEQETPPRAQSGGGRARPGENDP